MKVRSNYHLTCRGIQIIHWLFFCCSFYFILLLFFFFDSESGYVAQAGLELKILLSLPPECWNFRCVLTIPSSVSTELSKNFFLLISIYQWCPSSLALVLYLNFMILRNFSFTEKYSKIRILISFTY